jgi:hypothetical protein
VGYLDPPSDEVVFSIGPAQYRLSEIVRAAGRWGDLTALEETVRQGLACAQRADQTETLPTDGEIEAAASEFRYDRDLIAADEMEAWLDRWGLSFESWTAYLQRLLLRQRWADDLSDLVSQHPVSQEEIDEVVHVEGICSGHYGRVAHTLAAQLAAYERARDEGWLAESDAAGDEPGAQSRLDAALELFRARAVTPAAIRAEVASHHLDWVRVDCELVSFADLNRAREAILCVREDGRELAQVAADARTVLHRANLYLGEVEPAWRDPLLGARESALVGPLSRDGAFVVLLVREKALPTAEDPDVRGRAEASVLDRALEQEISHRVKWHHRL